MKTRKSRIFAGDFETTVYDGQVNTEVWASACVELYGEDVKVFHSISEQLDYFISLDCNIICYYHNLKFDGTFWLAYLLVELGFTHSCTCPDDNIDNFKWNNIKDMKNREVMYSISNMGQWYKLIFKVNNRIIELRDSLNLLPFTLKRIGDSFKTKHRKLEMEYKGFRYAGCDITDEEMEYIANDVLVLKEALEIMFTEGHKKLTIGSCCLTEYKKLTGHKRYISYFPNLYEYPLNPAIYTYNSAGEYIKQAYRGGWCYVVKGKENRVFHGGTTADVNSLYPSMMSSESNNRFPVGEPTFWSGNYIPEEALQANKYYYIRIKTRFYLKPGYLPFVQIKNTLMYKATEMLTTSDVYNHRDKKYHDYYIDINGNIVPAIVTLTMTMTDFRLLQDHYNLVDFEILDGCYFDSAIGIFDTYIEKYKKIKLESTGALRELAKLFLNNLYGKMATNTNSSFKVAYIKEDKSLGFYTVVANDKEPGYIPVGAAITSYARNFTIRAAQQNYHGVNKHGFIYADTDSIHCDLPPDELVGVKEHSKNFCCWKFESCWDEAIFVRQKTYIEHITHENRQPVDKPYYNIKCAGMPEKCKRLLTYSFGEEKPNEKEIKEKYSEEEIEFMSTERAITDFKIGIKVPGKLLPKRIRGGIILVDTPYEMR